ncbi:MAG: Uncharacterized protein G01um101416_892 [Microgenomates group bacterium Gr01-1014_16]|nr:MAG: Uncharacterized protein G01um101416_892 [Microgenomates group bacterium Gr01-1014_16]
MITAEFLYVMMVVPTLFGMTLLGEGIYKLSHYEDGRVSVILGAIFLAGAVFGYFYLIGSVK